MMSGTMEYPATTAHVLMKKGKRGAAAYVHADCANSGSSQHLNDLLNLILNPCKMFDWETIDWCKWLIAGGRTPDEFESIVLRYDNATTCGLVWTANFVAYRCRTCGISPCMSLCAHCFQNGNHDGHDFNMFRSQAGGACDCGDTNVMKETGFCDRHGPKAQVNKPSAPADLMCVASVVMPRLMLRLVQHLRENSKSGVPEVYLLAIQDADAFLSMLNDFSAMGAAMRKVMTASFTNPQVYRNLTEIPPEGTDYYRYMVEGKSTYEEALKSLPSPEPPDEYKDCPALQEQLVHRTFLDELVFWTVKFEFPQKMVCLLLNMLPDPDYKEALTQAFVLHYSRISMMLERSHDPDTLSNRVVHVSVQLFSNESLALRMAVSCNLLHVMVISLKYMMSKILVQNTLHDVDKNYHYVVDCGRQVMKEHCYWPVVSDLNNLLSHKPVAIKFMSDDNLLEMWFAFLSMFQGMNVNQRELTQHVEFEPNTYYAAFSAELEASAYPMWGLVSHLTSGASVDLTRRVLASCLAALQEWLDAINFTSPSIDDSLQVSFHLPLHRYLAVFMCQAIKLQGLSLRDVLPPRDVLALVMMHPLRVQVAFYEILSGMWVRNGLQIKGQAMTYIQCNFCNSLADADLYLLQVCATQVAPEKFLTTVLEKFHIMDWMSLASYSGRCAYLDGEYDSPMLESCLTFLATLMSVRTNLGESDASLSRLEMVTLLCMGDKTHSQLIEMMPERCGTAQSRDFETVLSEVANYRAPNLEASGNMQQGMYMPKPKVWEEMYDPIHVLLRAVHRRDFQTSMDRFAEHVQQSGKMRGSGTPWPPFRAPAPCHSAYEDPRKVLRSRVFHAVVFVVLYKAVHGHSVSEHVLALLLYLLEMAVATADQLDHTQVCKSSQFESREIKDKDLTTWYKSDWLSDNLRTVINVVKIDFDPAALYNSSDSEGEWEMDRQMDGPPRPEAGSMLMLESGEGVGPGPVLALEAAGGGEQHAMALQEQEIVALDVLTSMATAEGPATTQPALPMTSPYHAPPPASEGYEIVLAESVPGPSTSQAGLPALPPSSSSTVMVPVSGSNAHPSRMTVSLARKKEVVPSASAPPRKLHTRRQVTSGGAATEPDKVEVNESIISLLLKLHSHLSGVPDSYVPFDLDAGGGGGPADCHSDSRIGDGQYFVARLLQRVASLDSLCRDNIIETRNSLWPRKQEESEEKQKEREEKEREDRRRRARERQEKLMAEFATKQKQFWEKAMETDEEGLSTMDWNEEEGSALTVSKKEYDCVICNQTTPSTEDRPMGLVVLVQSTSVLAHKRRSPEPADLPVSDERSGPREDNLGAVMDQRMEEMTRYFDSASCVVSVNLGWDGGVHLQTCGHHLHLDCQKSYLLSLRSQQRQQSLAVDRGEYWCPLCRQLANSVLPLSPQLGECTAMVRSRPVGLVSIVYELTSFLKELHPDAAAASNLKQAMAKAMEDMTKSMHKKFHQNSFLPTHHGLFQFVSSIARTNLEVELVQRGGSLCSRAPAAVPDGTAALAPDGPASLTPKRSCIVPLLHVLAMHSRTLAQWPVWRTWQDVAGVHEPGGPPYALAPVEKEVPILLRDPSALLVQFLLVLPLHLDQTYFSGVVKVLYNLLYVQVVAQLSCCAAAAERARWRAGAAGATSLEAALSLVVQQLDHSQIYLQRDAAQAATAPSGPQQLEQEVQQLCLPFLRLAALLRHHLYDQPLPEATSPRSEFVRLVYYLELVTEGMDWGRFNAAVGLSWAGDGAALARGWCGQLAAFARQHQNPACSLLEDHHVSWHQPRLMRLPQDYDKIFQYYHRRQCGQCNLVPREASVCLLCGTLVCLKETCCKHNACEAVQHSIDCGGGTAMYLVVTSSYIIVIRGKRACLWGSVYLDSFGEEDRELKRGKPLYLSAGRYQLLEQQWLAHRFDHTNKKWVWHRDAL